MSSRLRFLIALLLSASGLTGTVLYYQKTAPKLLGPKEAEPVATVRGMDGTHRSRRERSTFWNPLQEGDPLFVGDEIKTGETGSLRLQFIHSTDDIELEAHTQIRMDEENKNPIVHLEEGFIQAIPKEGSQVHPQFKAANEMPMPSKLALITLDEKKILKLIYPDNMQLKNPQGIQLLKPNSEFAIELNPDAPEATEFLWEQGKAGYRIAIQWGSTRKDLSQKMMVNATEHKINMTFPIGRHYWRWAIFQEGLPEPVWVSETSRVFVKGLFPPAAVSPVAGNYVRLKDASEKVTLKWLPSKKYSQLKMQLYADIKGEKLLKEANVAELSSMDVSLTKLGFYSWRLSGFETEKKRWIQSKLHQFRVGMKDIEKVDIKWTTEVGSMLRYTTSNPTAHLAWSTSGEGKPKQFRVKVVALDGDIKTAQAQFTDKNELEAKVEKSGRFKAVVEALNNELEPVGQSTVLNFEVMPVPMLRAPAMVSESLELRATPKGQLQLDWGAVSNAREYVIELTDSSGKNMSFGSKKNSYFLTKLMPGIYELRIAAIDQNGRVGEKTEMRKLYVPAKNSLKAVKIKKVEIH